MPHTLVVHCKVDPYDVYIGRGIDPSSGRVPTRNWGNPFILGRDGDRTSVLERHRLYILQRPHLVDVSRMELKDKRLGCWCAPKGCHGDFLAELAKTVPVPHENSPCTCTFDQTCHACNGLYVCKYCGGGEGSLPSECPRVQLTGTQGDDIYIGKQNYIAGQWVDGCYDTVGKQNMPCWAGEVHVVERNVAA